MIGELSISNFQSHKDTVVELCDGVNAFVGDNGAGKSVLVRGLWWLAFNRPTGDEFLSWWASLCEVSAIVDGQRVVRRKGKGVNEYLVGDKLFRAFNQEVPVEVTAALRLSELNFQRQMDSPFLLSSGAGEVARYLNEVARLESIDVAMEGITSALRATSATLAAEQSTIVQLVARENQLAPIDDLRAKADEIDRLTSEMNDKKTRAAALLSLGKQAAAERKAMTQLHDVLAVYGRHDLALDSISYDLEQKNDKARRLAAAIDSAERAIALVEFTSKREAELHNNMHKLMPKVCPLCEGTGKLKQEY